MTPNGFTTRKTALENQIDSLDLWMIGFTWPVAIGLFIEFYAILNVGWTHNLNVLIDRIGLFLVTVGVSGELAVEHKAHGAERRLREVNADIEHESSLTLKAADERIAELNLKRIKLETKLTGRSLTPEQFSLINHRMRDFSDHQVYVGACVNTFEAAMFGTLLVTFLQMAKLNACHVELNSRLFIPGIHLFPAGNNESERVAETLRDTLREIEMLANSYPPDNTAWVESFWPQGPWNPDGKMVLIVVSDNTLFSPPSPA